MPDSKKIMYPDASILLVEDEPSLMFFMKSVISKLVGNIYIAENGIQGLEIYKENNPDLIITDISMPSMDGLTMSIKIRELYPNANIIIITALDDSDSLIKTINIGVNQFLLKPVDKSQLEETIKCALKNIYYDKDIKQKNSVIKFLSSAIEQSPLMILIMTLDGQTEYVNPAFCNLIGVNSKQLKDTNSNVIDYIKVKGFDFKGFHSILDKSDPVWNGEFCIIRPTGEEAWVQANVSPIRNENGEVTHIIKILKDISDRKNYEKQLQYINDTLEQRVKQRTNELESLNQNLHLEIEARLKVEDDLRQAKEQAESANKMKSLFLAKVTHELRTPLNGIIGVSSILQDSDLDAKQKKFIKMLKLSGENLLKIINDILEVSKIENGTIKLNIVFFKLRDLIEQTFDIISVTATEKKLDISYNIDSNIPDNLIGDSVKLQQILINLLNNAIKFTNRGSIKVDLKLISNSNNLAEIYFSITDSGIGIKEDKLNSIFKSFSQVDNSLTRKYGGIGLGLSISKEFVELMGGKISVESKFNHGSKFYFNVKMNVALNKNYDDKIFQDNEENIKLIADKYNISNLTILVAEDSWIMQEFIKNGFSLKNWDITIVSNGLEAIEAYKSKKFDIIIMDMLMPEMNGYEAASVIRQIEGTTRHTPIIGLTADNDIDTAEEMKKYMDVILTKPFKWDEIFGKINNLIDNSRYNKYHINNFNIENILDNLNNNKSLLIKISSYFIENYQNELNELKESIINNEHDKARMLSHKIKSEVNNFGADAAVGYARQIESMSKSKNLINSLEVYQQLEFEMINLSNILKNVIELEHY